jgi:hypothetical protein
MKRLNRIVWMTLALVVWLLLVSVGQASACSCAGKEPVCEAFGTATAVFVGKVVGGKEQREEKDENGAKMKYDVGEIYFKVEEAFIGVKGPRVVIHSGTGGSDCGFWFRRGERYLVYAYGDSAKSLSTHICTRTRPLAFTDEDMAFLHNLPHKGTGARIYGTVLAVVKDPDPAKRRNGKPLSGITVKVEGAGKALEAITDDAGKYELAGLAPGSYEVYAELPDYYYKDDYSTRTLKLNDRGCSEEDFIAVNDSSISGQILKPDGSGLLKANVELIPLETAENVVLDNIDYDWTDEEGLYTLEKIPPGRYLLGININSTPDDDCPYPRTFYPGVTERSKATVIDVGWGDKLTGIDIQVPPKLSEHTVSGFVIWPDGSLAAGVDVYLAQVNFLSRCVNGCSFKTDAQGRFTLRGYDGSTYKVITTADKVGVGGKQQQQQQPQPVFGESPPITLDNDADGIRLVLSSPGNPWDREDEEKKRKDDEKKAKDDEKKAVEKEEKTP